MCLPGLGFVVWLSGVSGVYGFCAGICVVLGCSFEGWCNTGNFAVLEFWFIRLVRSFGWVSGLSVSGFWCLLVLSFLGLRLLDLNLDVYMLGVALTCYKLFLGFDVVEFVGFGGLKLIFILVKILPMVLLGLCYLFVVYWSGFNVCYGLRL